MSNKRILATPLTIYDPLNFQTLGSPTFPRLLEPLEGFECRLIPLDEINEEAPTAYRNAVTNVFSAFDAEMKVSLLYILEGGPKGVSLYFGLAGGPGLDLHESMRVLRGTLEGQLPGVVFGPERENPDVLAHIAAATHRGLVLGVPTPQEEESASEENHSQGIERLVRNLISSGRGDGNANQSRWQVVLVAEPIPMQAVRQRLNATHELQSQLAMLSRTSIQTNSNKSTQRGISTGSSNTQGRNESQSTSTGKNESGTEGKSWGRNNGSGSTASSSGTNSGESQSKTFGKSIGKSTTTGVSTSRTKSENFSLSKTDGSSYGVTQEFTNKRAQWLHDRVEKEIVPQLERGLTKGLFRSVIYVSAEHKSTYIRLKNTIRATFQGSKATLNPLRVQDLPQDWILRTPALPRIESSLDQTTSLLNSLDTLSEESCFGNLWSAPELAIVAGLPQRELPGIRRRKAVPFAIDLPDIAKEQGIELGPVVDLGRRYRMHPVNLNRADLNKHIFITGVTGAGKTTTCLRILTESKLPFLIIEPAKTEYRALAPHFPEGIDFYRPNGDPQHSLRINPFALVRPKQRIKSHASFLKNVFATILPLEASMPQMVEAAILAAYEEKGWDRSTDAWLGDGDPFDPAVRAWPTMSDMIRQLDRLIPAYGLGKEFEEKYRGSLVSRLRGLTDGTLGGILDAPQSLDWRALLRRNVVIELEELQSGEEKALLMALILGAVNEAIRDGSRSDPACRHLTLVEEAHRLLSRPEPGDSARSMAVEAFADMLAEVRKYGEGLIIADQIPAKLIPDVIKNTHTKIVHRLFAEDDRRTMAEAMMMNEAQRDFLPNLAAGEAVIFCGGWHGAVHAAIDSGPLRTDGAQLDEAVLDSCYQRQLWRERERYYPALCQVLGTWLTASEGPQRFAVFVMEAQRAWMNVLKLVHSCRSPSGLASNNIAQIRAFADLRNWCEKSHDQFDDRVMVARVFIALLLDANLRPRVENEHKNPSPIIADRRDTEELALLIGAVQTLIDLVEKSRDAKELCTAIKAADVSPDASARHLVNALVNPLSHYQSI